MLKRTPLFQSHVDAGARMVDFGGWEMPVNYGSQIEEHHLVRRAAGMFDVSHMCVVDVNGSGTIPFLRRLLANDVARLTQSGKALYSCMLNPEGGVIDDLIVYYMEPEWVRIVVNAGTADKDIAWMQLQAEGFAVSIEPRRELAMIAVQGPEARAKVHAVLPEQAEALTALGRFYAHNVDGMTFIGRTGYTGEDGYEIMLPAHEAPGLWQRLLDAGVLPAGLGARDTLRLEAGMNLYGQDMDENTSPLISGLAWTLWFKDAGRDFIGRAALEAEQATGVQQRLVGLVLEGKGVLRAHQRVVVEGAGEGEITSGTFSPTLGVAIALARIPVGEASHCQVDIRGKLLPARIVAAPFVRDGQSCLA